MQVSKSTYRKMTAKPSAPAAMPNRNVPSVKLGKGSMPKVGGGKSSISYRKR